MNCDIIKDCNSLTFIEMDIINYSNPTPELELSVFKK